MGDIYPARYGEYGEQPVSGLLLFEFVFVQFGPSELHEFHPDCKNVMANVYQY